MRLWLEQKSDSSEAQPLPAEPLPAIHCSRDQKRKLQEMAQSRTIGIWRMKRAKVILGTLEGKALERLVVDLRVPPESIIKCVEGYPDSSP